MNVFSVKIEATLYEGKQCTIKGEISDSMIGKKTCYYHDGKGAMPKQWCAIEIILMNTEQGKKMVHCVPLIK